MNPHYGPKGLELLRSGIAAPEVVRRLTAPDEGREQRQLHVIDAAGRVGQHTGKQCVDWCGAVSGEGYSVAGNMLANERVVRETASAFEVTRKSFAERLLAALEAGEAAGGDKRGKQSAALLVHGGEDWPELDIRVDDHADPLAELARLEAVSHQRWVHFRRFLPSRANPAGIFDRAVIDAEIERALGCAQDSGEVGR
jgi:uncharacterized Ntn-hydrolase superfamily protein